MKSEELKNQEYKYGFTTEIENFKAPKGLSGKLSNLFLKLKKNLNGCWIGDLKHLTDLKI